MRKLIFLFSILFFVSCNMYDAEYYLNKAIVLEEEGKYEEAITLLDKGYKKDTTNLYIITSRAADKSALGRYDEAIEDYLRAVKVDSNNILAYYNLGLNNRRLKRYSQANIEFNKAVAIIKNQKGMIKLVIVPNPALGIEGTGGFDLKLEEILLMRGINYYSMDSLQLAENDLDFCIKNNYSVAESYLWFGSYSC